MLLVLMLIFLFEVFFDKLLEKIFVFVYFDMYLFCSLVYIEPTYGYLKKTAAYFYTGKMPL